MSRSVGALLGIADAMAWVRGSLADGSALAHLVNERIEPSWSALLLAEDVSGPRWEEPLSPCGRGQRGSAADALASRLLDSLTSSGPRTLIVEDDAARRGDPHLGGVAFVGERVVRWRDLEQQPAESVALLRGSGHPLNAFVCRGPAQQLGLEADRPLGDTDVASIADAAEVVIVSAYDGEAFVALVAAPVADALGAARS